MINITSQEKSEIYKAVCHLAAMDDDRATERNGCGFAKSDVHVGHIAAEMPQGDWDDELVVEVAGALIKYCNTQLTEFDTDTIKRVGGQASGRDAIRAAIEQLKIENAAKLAEKLRQTQLERHMAGRIIHCTDTSFVLRWWRSDPDFEAIRQTVRCIPTRFWSNETHSWLVDNMREDVRPCIEDLAHRFGFKLCADSKALMQVKPRHSRCIFASETDGTLDVFFDYDAELVAAVKTIKGRKFDGLRKCWTIPTGELQSLLDMGHGFELTECAKVAVSAHTERAKTLAEPQATCSIAPAFPLFPHQVSAIEYLQGHSLGLLTDEMGLGKTISALMALPERSAALVVCPAALKGNWVREAKVWRPDLAPVVLKGRGSFRFPAPGEIVITNYELLPKPDALSEMAGGCAHRINAIVDEAHYLKRAKTIRAKSYRALRKLVVEQGGSSWLMTGTPMITKPMDLWGVLESAGLARRAYGSFGHFADVWGGYKGRFGYEWNPRKIQAGSAQSGLSRVSIGRKRVDVLPDLPAKRWADLVVKVPRGVGELDRRTMDELIECGEDAEAIRKNKALVGQLAAARKDLASAKANAAKDYIEEVLEGGGGPLVVFSAHRDAAYKLGNQSGWEAITGETPAAERTRIVEAFQAGELVGIAGTIGAMGTGLTLTRSHRMIFIDLDWSPANNAQAEDRINRIGQKSACEYVRLIADCEVDRIIHAAITRKDQMIYHVDEARRG